ncbi:MAG: immunoglobulin domain-containing protein, partial [Verrucomicrobiae bacterium]|nr:immunoglobulin domain-containing protein [Verrucomicrobiae bacterium]
MTLAEVAEPVITAQPLGADALLGQPYTFSVGFRAATGTAFQWRKNGVAITGATQQFLNLPALAFTDAGRYSVIVSNAFGTVTSSNATLTVNEITGSRDTAVGSVFINNDVYAIEIMPDGSAIIGGEFSQVGGAAHPMFARINADGTRFGGAWTDANLGGTGIRTYDFELQSSGKILIGGDIASIQGTTISKLARLNADGTLDTTFVGTTFNSFLRTIAALESDKFFIGGNFTVGPRQFLALMNEDGTVDTSFQLNPNDTVAKILRLADGKIMVAGRFTTLGGQTANRVARLNADFTLDPTFNAPVFNNQVEDMDIDGIGRPVVVGFFTTVDGQSRNYAARLNTDGSLDSTFDMGTALNQVAYAVDVQLNGKIVIGGQFTGRITRVLENGGVDPFYSKNFTPNATVFEVVTTPDGKLYIGGGFTQPVASFMRATTDKSDPAVTANPQSVAIDLGGSASLNVGVFTTTTAAYQWFKNGNPIPGATDASLLLTGVTRADAGSYSVDVTTSLGSASSGPANVTVLAEPQILNEPPPALLAVTGGEIRLTVAASGRGPLSYTWQKDGNPLPTEARITGATTPGLIISNAVLSDAGRYSVSISNNLGSTNSRPTVATVIIPPGGIRDTFSTADTPNGAVEIIVPVDGGDLVIGGSFTTVRGESHQRLARLTSDGSIVSGFTATANNTVYDIAAQPDGKLIVVGAFTQINGLAKNRVARLNSDGSLDTTFDVGTGPNGTVLGTAVQPDGRILVVGQFSQVTGTTRSYAARLNADGSLDPSFDITAFHYGHDVAVLDDGRILIGGRGTMLGRNYLVRLHPDGTLDTNFNHTVNQPVYHVLPQADGKVVISGQFSSVDSVNKTGIARLNADGTLDSGFNAFTTSTLLVNSLAAQYDGKIVLGGSFTSFNGETRNRLVRLTPDGSLDALFDTGTGFNAGSVNALYLTPNGNIWAGGTFSSYNGTASASLVQLNGDPVLLAITRHPTGQQLDLGSPGTLTAGATGTSTITYQWHKDGSPILGANNATLTFGSATRTDAGDYFVTAGNDSGSLTSRVARVTVLAEPVITRQPDSTTVADGTPVTLSVSALGAGALGYQWRRNGVAIGNANGPSLILPGVVADSDCYDVVITNALGGVTSEAAALGIYVAAGTIDPGFAPPGGANNIVFA